jgi:hypothetical protein
MAGKRGKGHSCDNPGEKVLPLLWFGEHQSRLPCLAVSTTSGGASNMAARWAMRYLWSVLVNPTPGWQAWLSPPLLEALQIWRPGEESVTFALL